MTDINKKTVVCSAIIAIVVALGSAYAFDKCCASKSNFGVVNLQRIVSVSKDVATLRADREAQVNELKKMADDANAAIEKIKDEDKKKAATERYLAEIQVKKNEFDNAYNMALQASDTKIKNVIESVAEKRNLSIVLSNSSVVTGGEDITEAVVDLVK